MYLYVETNKNISMDILYDIGKQIDEGITSGKTPYTWEIIEDNIQGKVDTLENEIESLGEDILQLQQEIDDGYDNINALKDTIEIKNDRISELESITK